MIVLLTTRDKDNKLESIRKKILESYIDIYFNGDTSAEMKATNFIQ